MTPQVLVPRVVQWPRRLAGAAWLSVALSAGVVWAESLVPTQGFARATQDSLSEGLVLVFFGLVSAQFILGVSALVSAIQEKRLGNRSRIAAAAWGAVASLLAPLFGAMGLIYFAGKALATVC